jgi:hypothetical protein
VHHRKITATQFLTNKADIYRGIVLLALFLVVGIFIAFDAYTERHQNKVLMAAKQADAIVRSLFPAAVADRLYEDARKKQIEKKQDWNGPLFETPKSRVKNFMRQPDGHTANSGDSDEANNLESEPIADLFPNTTVMFADLAGECALCS